MPAIPTTALPRPGAHRAAVDRTTPSKPAVWLVTVVTLCGAFFLTEHRLDFSRLERYQVDAEVAGDSVADGHWARRLAFAFVALLGAGLFVTGGAPAAPSARREPWSVARRIAVAGLASYLLWSGLSLLWSIAPTQTLKRLAVAGLSFVGIAGLARRLSPTAIATVAAAVAGTYVAIGLATELAFGTFRPWAAGYRFAGTVHPNTQATYCTVLAFASFFARQALPAQRGWFTAGTFAGAIGLLLTKSRTGIVAVALALLAYWLLEATLKKKLFAATFASLAVGLGLFTWLFTGHEMTGPDVARAAQFGRDEDLESIEELLSLSGRVPLWTDLASFVAARPLTGYGYEGFWNPRQIAELSEEFSWTIPNGHSLWFDTLLNLGAVGLGLLVLAGGFGFREAVRAFRASRDPGLAFTLTMVLFGVTTSFFESDFTRPSGFVPFVTFAGLVGLLLFRNDEEMKRETTS